MRSTHLWFLPTAAYGIVNAIAKWQTKSDECFEKLGVVQYQQISRLFYRQVNGKIILVAAKILVMIKQLMRMTRQNCSLRSSMSHLN